MQKQPNETWKEYTIREAKKYGLEFEASAAYSYYSKKGFSEKDCAIETKKELDNLIK